MKKKNIRNMGMYAGLTKDEYAIIEPTVRSNNRVMLLHASFSMAAALLALTIASFFVGNLAKNRTIYVVTFAIGVAIYIFTKLLAHKYDVLGIAVSYVFLGSAFAFSIILGVPLQTDSPATTFCVMLFALPLLILDRPLRIDIFLTVTVIVFTILSGSMKPYNIALLDITNGICFLLLSIVVNYLIARTKCHDLLMERMAVISYQKHLESTLRSNARTIGTFRLNLTQNSCGEGSSSFSNAIKLQSDANADSFLSYAATYVPNANERKEYKNKFNREHLLKLYNDDITYVCQEHHYRLDNQNNIWIRTSVDMMKNPYTDDVEGVLYAYNIHMERVLQAIISEITSNDYEMLAIVYENTAHYIYVDTNNSSQTIEGDGFYIFIVQNILKDRPENKDEVLSHVNRESVENALEKDNRYVVMYTGHGDDGARTRKRISFFVYSKSEQIYFVNKRDVTDVYEMEEKNRQELAKALTEARKADAAKSEFLSKISHDIRTPMNGIIGMADIIAEEYDIEKIHNYNSKVKTSAGFLLGLVNDVLDVSKIESGNIELHPVNYPFEEFIEYIDAITKPLCDEKKIHFTKYFRLNVELIVDKLRFNQICFNLLSNAVKYTQDGGRVSLETREISRDDNTINFELIVSDNGMGMSEEFQGRLFERFTQEERRVGNESIQGSGLGLSIVQQIVTLMNGSIKVNSKIDEGTQFIVKLSCQYITSASHLELNREKMTWDEYDFTGKRVLLCEDNGINAEIASVILTKSGMTVETAVNGEIGYEKFMESSEYYYDAILMDIRMPVMDGLEATRCIRSLDRNDAKSIPIIAMTANAFHEDHEKSVMSGMTAHLSKPINRKLLLETLAQYMGM